MCDHGSRAIVSPQEEEEEEEEEGATLLSCLLAFLAEASKKVFIKALPRGHIRFMPLNLKAQPVKRVIHYFFVVGERASKKASFCATAST